MQTLMIRAATGRSALELKAVLASFRPRLEALEGTYAVTVDLCSDAQIVDVLSALQDYVSERADGAARVDFNGHSYAMHPEAR